MILYLNIVANTLHSSVNGLLLMECMCLWTHLTGWESCPVKQRFGVLLMILLTFYHHSILMILFSF